MYAMPPRPTANLTNIKTIIISSIVNLYYALYLLTYWLWLRRTFFLSKKITSFLLRFLSSSSSFVAFSCGWLVIIFLETFFFSFKLNIRILIYIRYPSPGFGDLSIDEKKCEWEFSILRVVRKKNTMKCCCCCLSLLRLIQAIRSIESSIIFLNIFQRVAFSRLNYELDFYRWMSIVIMEICEKERLPPIHS